ncbi:MAG: GNAT family N-acetyltransferase [Granulicella sp.]
MTKHLVVLKDQRSGIFVDADLYERIDSSLAKRAEDSWQTYLATARSEAATSQRPFPKIDHEHWEWAEKVGLTERFLPYPTVGIECEGQVQGLMLLETDGHFARLDSQKGSPLVYVNLLATAPWNLSDVAAMPRFRGVGTVLLTAAVSTSVDLGFKGRLALHSLPKSQGWYDNLGMSCLGPDAAKHGLAYYEMTPEQAAELIR